MENKLSFEKKGVITPRFTEKKYILIGTRKDEEKVYLEQASWDCSWYYGFGYLAVLNIPKTDINEHYHFSKFFSGKHDAHTEFLNDMASCVLDDKELWQLCDLMKSWYCLKDAYEIYHRGNSHYTTIKAPNLKDPSMSNRLLADQKKIILAVMKLLSGQDIPILHEV